MLVAGIFAQHFGRVDTAQLADLFCQLLGTGKKKRLHYKCLHNLIFIFSQEIWVQVLMAMG
jgi:hypothetical protein